MAITLQTNPGSYYSVHGDLLFVVVDIVKASDPVTYPDYRYICDIYIGGSLVTRLKAYPRPDNKMGVFNIGNVVRNYVAAIFNPTANSLRAQELGQGEFFIPVICKFGEEYNFVLYADLTVDQERLYFNHYNGRLLGQNTSLAQYEDKPLTKREVHTAVTPASAGTAVYSGNKNNFVPAMFNGADNYTLRITSYTKDGTQIGQQDQNYSAANDRVLQSTNLSPAVINAAFPDLVNPLIASYYTVQFVTPNIAFDRIIKFNLVCEPSYEVFTLHFLNSLGGFESRDFTKISRKTIDIEKNEFGKLGYTMDTSGIVSYKSSGNVYNETRTVYSSQYKEKMVLNTDVLSDAEYNWLGDLILSPMIYIELEDIGGTTYFVPCVITENNYEFRKRINDKLTNLTINIEFGDQFNAQFR